MVDKMTKSRRQVDKKPSEASKMAKKKDVAEKYSRKTLMQYVADMSETMHPDEIKKFKTFLNDTLQAKKTDEVWRGLLMTPPASLLADLVTEFDRSTDFPLELPFFCFLHMLSGELINRDIIIEYDRELRHPQLWSVLISSSGGGKTTTLKSIRNQLGLESFWVAKGMASRAKFMEEFSENNKKLMVIDEWGMNAKKMRPGQPLEQVKEDLLEISVNEAVKHTSAKGVNVTIDHPVASMFGLTTDAPLESAITWEDLYSGLCQRIRFIFAHRTKPIQPPKHINLEHLKSKWMLIESKIKHQKYISHPLAQQAFDEAFYFFRVPFAKMDDSYFKRIMDEAHSYALLYHIILGKGEKEVIDLEDYGWAARVLGVLFLDAAEFIRKKLSSELDQTLNRVAEVIERVEATGRECKPRDIMRSIKSINRAALAKEYLEKIKSGEYTSPDDVAYSV